MSDYTPGPWKIWNGWGPASDGFHRALRIGPDNDGGIRTHTGDIYGSKADLELIAVAPELLNAAKAIIGWAMKNNRGNEGTELLEILCDTQRVITKLEGQDTRRRKRG